MKENKFRKTNLIISLCLAMIMLVSVLCVGIIKPNTKQVHAESSIADLDDNTEITKNSGLYQIGDEELYYALIDAYNLVYQSEPIQKLYVGAFKTFESLDLSGKNIEIITGLYWFKFDSLKTLNLSNNKINTNFENFDNMPVLESLDLSNNQITSFNADFSSKLSTINLKNNQITTCDLSTVMENSNIDISFNKISKFENLTLPQNNSTILATHNLLTEEKPENITCNLQLGFQGGVEGESIVKTSVFKFYGLEGVSGIDVYETDENGNKLTNTPLATIVANEQLTDFSIGYYKLVFNEGDTTPKNYADISLVCRPDKPVFSLYIGEEKSEKELHSVNQIVTLKMEAEGELYYTINGGEKVKGSEIKIDASGSYTVVCWQTLEGMDSEKVTYLVISNYVDPLTFVWLFLGVLAFAVLFYGAYLWSNHLAKPKTAKTDLKGKGFK